MKAKSAIAWTAAGLLLICIGCDSGNNPVNVFLDPPVADEPTTGEPDAAPSLAGSWTTTTSEVLDTCGFDPFPPNAPLLIEETGDSLVFTFVNALGFCDRSVRTRNGDLVSFTRTDTFEACNGTVRVQSEILYTFGEGGFVGSSEHLYSNLSGQCSNLPCEYRLSVAGQRCENCWPGCLEPSVASARTSSEAEQAGPFETTPAPL